MEWHARMSVQSCPEAALGLINRIRNTFAGILGLRSADLPLADSVHDASCMQLLQRGKGGVLMSLDLPWASLGAVGIARLPLSVLHYNRPCG